MQLPPAIKGLPIKPMWTNHMNLCVLLFVAVVVVFLGQGLLSLPSDNLLSHHCSGSYPSKKKHISCRYPRPRGCCSPASKAEQMQLFPKGLSSLQPVWIRVGNFNHGLPREWQSPVSLITYCCKGCFFNSLKQSLPLNGFFSLEKGSRMTPTAAIAHVAGCSAGTWTKSMANKELQSACTWSVGGLTCSAEICPAHCP